MAATVSPKTVIKKNGARDLRLPRVTSKEPKGFVSPDAMLTVKDWDALPDVKPRYELINGKLEQKVTTKRKHSKTAGYFLFQCLQWAEETGWHFFPEGTGVYITETNGFVPDVVGFAPDFPLNPEASYEAAPFLVCEVLSDSTAERDRTVKLRGYAHAGVQITIIVDPDARTFEVYKLKKNSYGKPEILADAAVWQPKELPGLKIGLARLWF